MVDWLWARLISVPPCLILVGLTMMVDFFFWASTLTTDELGGQGRRKASDRLGLEGNRKDVERGYSVGH